MKKFFFTTLVILQISILNAQTNRLDKIIQDVKLLSLDELKGREIGSEGEIKAANYISERMAQIGLEPKGEAGYFQKFSVTPKANPHSVIAEDGIDPIEGRNVIGFLNYGKDYTLVIGAHFDHLGMGGEGSLHVDEGIHNGADDNASGVALMLHLAEQLKESSREHVGYNYLFIAFSGEEKGLWGSNYFCKNPTIELAGVSLMINFDMVGRFEKERGLAISGVGTSPDLKDLLKKSNEKNVKLILGESGVGPSDHTSFYLQDIPVLHYFTGQHEDYHKPTDDFEKINIEGIEMIGDMVESLIQQLATKDKLQFIKTKEDRESTPRFTVALGVMPDYMYQGDGMRIDGVTEGKSASKAGLEKGDVVIKLGKVKVEGMQSYMKALSEFKKGDKTTVKVKRGEEEIKRKIVFQ